MSEAINEAELSDRCRLKDNIARKRFYELFAGRMMAICCRYAGSRELAQDLLHDGFLKAFNSFDKFTYRGEGSLKAWLSRIMVNTALEYLRKNDVLNQTLTLEEIPESAGEGAEEELERIPRKILMDFITELPTGYRTVFNLYTFEAKSHKEISKILSINEKSSASQLFRARALLAKKVNEYMIRHKE